jgi:hypothetical protein
MDEDEPLTRLDPDAAACTRREPLPPSDPPPVPPLLVDVRRYRWAVGIIGLAVVIGFSAYGFLTHHAGTGSPPRWPTATCRVMPTCVPPVHRPATIPGR